MWLRSLLVVAWLLPWASAAEPKISTQSFEHQPRNLLFFDDSEVALVVDREAGKIWRSPDAGATWTVAKDVGEARDAVIFKHPYDNKVAIAVGRRREHWVTKDQGASWKSFESPDAASPVYPVSFHALDSNRILFNGEEECGFYACVGKTWYTEDGFETSMKTLQDSRKFCQWAKTYDRFSTGDKQRDQNLVMCILEGKYSHRTKDYRLVLSEDFYKTSYEPRMSDGRTVSGITNMAAVKGFLVAAAKSEGTDELALFISNNAHEWHRAEFGEHKLEEDAYTLLESTNYSIQVDVQTQKHTSIGALFSSNSNGTYFTKNIAHTNRDSDGFVDFEKITDIQGIYLVNVVENWKEVEEDFFGISVRKKIKSKISFDDGRTFHELKTDDGKEELHLHSVTDQRNSGKIFSSPAPGMILGVGNTGQYMGEYPDGDLYVSDTAGISWKKALTGPHKYEFGDDGSVLVAVYDKGETDQIMYSINHGRDWTAVKLDKKVHPLELTTIPDSTSKKFILTAWTGTTQNPEFFLYSIDFNTLKMRKCESKDFEQWYARVDEKGEPSCLMGRKQWYQRRKADADCFVDEEFKDPEPKYDICKCSDADYECDYNFVRSSDRSRCEAIGKIEAPEGQCKTKDDTFKGSSGWRLIPGDVCEGGEQKEKLIDRPCTDSIKPPASGNISHIETVFKGARGFRQFYYLERGTNLQGADESVVTWTDQNIAYISRDHGKTWNEINTDGAEVVAIYPHEYNNDNVYFITPSKKVYYSLDRGKTIHHFDAPEEPNMEHLQILGFHPINPDWLLWIGGKDCGDFFSKDCRTVAHVSTNKGQEWKSLLQYVRKCQFVYREDRKESDQLVFCEQFKGEDTESSLQLLSSSDWFEHKDTHFQSVVNFATMSEFLVVAAKSDDGKFLKAWTSIDGKTFAAAEFPPNFQVPHQSAYTVLDSSTHAIFLHVTVNPIEGQEYGTIIKSNSNGTSYVLSINDVNRNTMGYVDFEKMQGLEGVALVNVVSNAKEVNKGAGKKLKTMITHNDGADWDYLKAPEKGAGGKPYTCKGGESCSLHLHGYTERKDPRDTYSSPSAVGLMLATGNVGSELGRYTEADTFITNDGGITWKLVMEGTYMWEYGDQGSIIVIVEDSTSTNRIWYTSDEGKNWTPYKISDSKVQVDRISTVPSDNSRNFLLWGRDSGNGNLITINIDFTQLTDRQCNLDVNNPEATNSDYTLWSPKHPLQRDNCLFGHVAQYLRKKLDSTCFNGQSITKLQNIARNCSCTRQDFECDYNFERERDGSCSLVKGLLPADPMAVCANPAVAEYYDITGYRRIPITTCEGGDVLDALNPHPCPGHEEEFKEKHGISGVGLFFAIVIPFAAAGAIGYWVWNNWDGKFGRIRLGETPGFDSESPWIAWPVAAVSAMVAVVAAIPLLTGSLWRSVSGRLGRGYGGRTYTSRSSFARGRGDYAVVDADEGELLGEDSDEDI